MRQTIGSFLAPLSQGLFEIVSAVPMGAVRALVFVILAALGIWVFRMPPQLPEILDRDKKVDLKDLRLFAIVVLLLQAVLYIVF
jgi:hypothetical protein